MPSTQCAALLSSIPTKSFKPANRTHLRIKKRKECSCFRLTESGRSQGKLSYAAPITALSRQPPREDFRYSLGEGGSLITDHCSYHRGVGRGGGFGRGLGVGVGLAVGVGVTVGVTVGVGVVVGVTVGVIVGVGVGVPPGKAKAYTLLSPAT